jgi:hypothetical protein
MEGKETSVAIEVLVIIVTVDIATIEVVDNIAIALHQN